MNDYTVQTSETITELTRYVRKLQKIDWVCQGGIFSDGNYFYQAMVRDDTK